MSSSDILRYMFGDNLKFSITIDNNFFEMNVGDKNKIDELYLYYVINRLVLDLNKRIILTTISVLSSIVGLQAVEKLNIAAITKALDGLRDKGYLAYEYLQSESKKDYLKPLLIEISREQSERFTVLEHWMFEKADNKKEFFVFAYISKWKNLNGYKISLQEWASHMGYSLSGVEDLLRRMEQDKKINIKSGKFVGGNSQEANTYEFVDDEIRCVIGDLSIEEIKGYIEGSNWGAENDIIAASTEGKYVKLEQGDYDIYRVCVDHGIEKEFVTRCENVLRKIKSGSKYDGFIEKYEEEYMRQKSELNS